MKKASNNVLILLLTIIIAVASYMLFYKDVVAEKASIKSDITEIEGKISNVKAKINNIESYKGSDEQKADKFIYNWYNNLFPTEVLQEDIVENITEISGKTEEGYVPITISDIAFGEEIEADSTSGALYNNLANYRQFNISFVTTYSSLQIFLDNLRKNMPKLIVVSLDATPYEEEGAYYSEPRLQVSLVVNSLASSSKEKKNAGSKYVTINEKSKKNIFDSSSSTSVTYELKLNKEIQNKNFMKLNYSKSDFYISLNSQKDTDNYNGENISIPSIIFGRTSSVCKALFGGNQNDYTIDIVVDRDSTGVGYCYKYSIKDSSGKETHYPTQNDTEKFVPVNSDKILLEILCNPLSIDVDKVKVTVNLTNKIEDMPLYYSLSGDEDAIRRVTVNTISETDASGKKAKGGAIEKVESENNVTTEDLELNVEQE